MTKLFVRTDASEEIGAGHAMRCLALSQAACNQGWRVRFFMKSGASLIREHGSDSHLSIRDINSEGDFCRAVQDDLPEWVVLDHYDLSPELERELRAFTKVLTIDDYAHRNEYAPSLLLNQNISAREVWYTSRGLNRADLLLGPDYVLLREQFLQANRINPEELKEINDIVLTLGGGDEGDSMKRVLTTLSQVAGQFQSINVLGHVPAGDTYPEQFSFHSHVTNMAGFFSGMDLAVSGGGSTLWELLYLGIPTIAIILAENQRKLVERLNQNSVLSAILNNNELSSRLLPDAILDSVNNQERLQAIVSRGQNLVDGIGKRRVLEAMTNRIED